jgi:hypothetical protein
MLGWNSSKQQKISEPTFSSLSRNLRHSVSMEEDLDGSQYEVQNCKSKRKYI